MKKMMKKLKTNIIRKCLICFFGLAAALLSVSVTAFAGDIPESLLENDDAQVFFGEVTACDLESEQPGVEVLVVKAVKGEVNAEEAAIYMNPYPVGDFEMKEGNIYLFTYYDLYNPTYIFETTSCDTQTLELQNAPGDMWARFEQYLNEGRYEEAEQRRVDKLNEHLKYEMKRENISNADAKKDKVVQELTYFYDLMDELINEYLINRENISMENVIIIVIISAIALTAVISGAIICSLVKRL